MGPVFLFSSLFSSFFLFRLWLWPLSWRNLFSSMGPYSSRFPCAITMEEPFSSMGRRSSCTSRDSVPFLFPLFFSFLFFLRRWPWRNLFSSMRPYSSRVPCAIIMEEPFSSMGRCSSCTSRDSFPFSFPFFSICVLSSTMAITTEEPV